MPVPQTDLHGCGNIFPLGVTGTPAYNPGNGQVYGVAETTGYHHMLVALTITDGRGYAAFGGPAGDCGAVGLPLR